MTLFVVDTDYISFVPAFMVDTHRSQHLKHFLKAKLLLFNPAPFLYAHQLNNPDMRVVILKDFVKANFPATPVLDYALEVEKITTSKVCFTV